MNLQKNNIFAHRKSNIDHKESWQSGRLWQSRKLLSGQLDRGFESLALRNKNPFVSTNLQRDFFILKTY